MTQPSVPAAERGRPALEASELALRELMAVREIAHAFLTADRPEEVYRFALERVTPLVGAAFASVFLVDGASDLMPLVAAYNWPERYRPWLGEMKVRLGQGPSGIAASDRRAVEVPDVFADPSLSAWTEVASELGFRALVALPLQTAAKTLGAVCFYFAEPGGFTKDQRGTLRIVADQMAATAEKASLITELRRTNAALMEANAELERQYLAVIEAKRVKDEFLANISHELRTPLTAVMGYIALMQEGLSGPLTTEQSRDLENVSGASERLLALVDDLLELTTLKRGGLEVKLEEFDPREPVRAAVQAAKGRHEQVTLTVEEPETMLPPMKSDRRKIEKVLITLLGNAYKFTPKGEVRVGLSVRNGRVTYRVADTGIGIPAEAQHHVFEEFRQVDGSATRKYGGTGLGLALSRRLARLLGGDLSFTSAAGQGTTFTVDLPLETDPEATRVSMRPALVRD